LTTTADSGCTSPSPLAKLKIARVRDNAIAKVQTSGAKASSFARADVPEGTKRRRSRRWSRHNTAPRAPLAARSGTLVVHDFRHPTSEGAALISQALFDSVTRV
jgi:hypothetical protein